MGDLNPALLTEGLQLIYGYMNAILVAVGRPIGLFIIFPVITRAQLGNLARIGIALVMIMPVWPLATQGLQVGAGERSMVALGVLTGKEVAVGVLIGAVLGLPFWAIQALGELIDVQRGVTSSDVQDAATNSATAVTGLLVGFVSAAVFVSSGGLLILADTLYVSYEIWPAQEVAMRINAAGLSFLADMIDHVFRYALVLGGPMLILLWLTDVALAFLSRAAPQIVTPDVSPTAKNLVYAAFVSLYGLFIVRYMGDEIASVHRASDLLREMLE